MVVQRLALLLKRPAFDSKTQEKDRDFWRTPPRKERGTPICQGDVEWSRWGETYRTSGKRWNSNVPNPIMAQSGERVSITFHRACWMNVARSGSVAPIQPLDVVQVQHIAFSTNRTVNICSVESPSSLLGYRFWFLHKRSKSPIMYHPTCKRTGLGSIEQQFAYVRVWKRLSLANHCQLFQKSWVFQSNICTKFLLSAKLTSFGVHKKETLWTPTISPSCITCT